MGRRQQVHVPLEVLLGGGHTSAEVFDTIPLLTAEIRNYQRQRDGIPETTTAVVQELPIVEDTTAVWDAEVTFQAPSFEESEAEKLAKQVEDERLAQEIADAEATQASAAAEEKRLQCIKMSDKILQLAVDHARLQAQERQRIEQARLAEIQREQALAESYQAVVDAAAAKKYHEQLVADASAANEAQYLEEIAVADAAIADAFAVKELLLETHEELRLVQAVRDRAVLTTLEQAQVTAFENYTNLSPADNLLSVEEEQPEVPVVKPIPEQETALQHGKADRKQSSPTSFYIKGPEGLTVRRDAR